jgi:magnesium-dependent phosphatase 1
MHPCRYELEGGAPFCRDSKGAVFSNRGEHLYLIGASEAILRELVTDPKWHDTAVAYVSRTEYPERAIPVRCRGVRRSCARQQNTQL